jgi:AraC-like DNA-binding protein
MKAFMVKRYPLAPQRVLKRSITASVVRYENGRGVQWHHHAHGQLVFVVTGVVRVLTPSQTWTIPSSRAVWLPPDMEHGLVAVGDTDLGGVYIDPGRLPWKWREPTLIAASSLMRELAITLAEGDDKYEQDSEAALAAALLLKILPRVPAITQASLPLPRDERLLQICEYLMNKPGCEQSLDFWGEHLGASSRTLARRFKDETGLTFRAWRQQMRVAEAISRLAQGQSVVKISEELGYGSPSAFIAMFRQVTGESPQRYLSSK